MTTTTTITARPSLHDNDFIRSFIVDELLDDAKRYFDHRRHGDKGLIADLIDVLDYSDDGYEMCQQLDNGNWDQGADLVAFLDRAASELKYAHDRRIQNWVRDNKIETPFKIGDRVSVAPLPSQPWCPRSTGTIGLVFAYRAEVGVCYDCDGRDGDPSRDPKFITRVEDVQSLS